MADDTDYAGLAGSIFGKSAGFLNDALSRGAGDMAKSRDMEGQALNGGLSYLQNWDQNHPTNLPLLMGAGAMLGPTKTGSFSESLGNAFTAGGGALRQAQQAEMERQEKMMRLQMAQSALARKPYEDTLGLAKTGFGGLGELSNGAGVVSDFQFLNGLRGGKRADASDPTAVGGPQVADAAPVPDGAPAAPAPDLSAVASAPDAPAPAAAPAPAPQQSNVAMDPDLPAPGAVEAGGAPFTPPDPNAGATPASVATPDAPTLPSEGSVGIQQAQRIVQMYNANPAQFRGPQAQKYLEAARKIIAESPETEGLKAGYKAAQETPYKNQEMNARLFTENNHKVKQEAYTEAQQGTAALNNARAIRQLWVDPATGKLNVNGGPSGEALANVSQRMVQMGFSPGVAKMLTGTDPNDAAAMAKLQTAIGSEIAKMEMSGSPVRVGEFQRFMNSSPGANVPGKAALWIIDNALIPKANAQVGRYKAIAGQDLGKTDLRDKLFEYDTQNPWFTPGANPDQSPDKQPVQGKATAITPDQARAELARRRASGAQ